MQKINNSFGGGLPLIFMVAALTRLGQLMARQPETTVPNTPSLVPGEPERSKESAGRRSSPAKKKQLAGKRPAPSIS